MGSQARATILAGGGRSGYRSPRAAPSGAGGPRRGHGHDRRRRPAEGRRGGHRPDPARPEADLGSQRTGVFPAGQGRRLPGPGHPGDRVSKTKTCSSRRCGPECATSCRRPRTSSTISSRSWPACSTRSAPSASWPSRGSSPESTRPGGGSWNMKSPSANESSRPIARPRNILRLMVESVKDFALFTVDPQGRVASWNPGAEHLFGYTEQEILGQSFAVLFTQEDQDGGIPKREIATAAAKGRSSDERWHRRKDGSRFFASGVLTPIFDEENRLRGFTKIARDITERKKAEEAVREAAVRLKAIVDTAVDGIITIDEQGTVESMNSAAERIFGLTHEEVVGQEHRHADHRARAERARSGPREHSVAPASRRSSAASPRSRDAARTARLFPMELALSETRSGPPPNLHRDRSGHLRVQESRRGTHAAAQGAGSRTRPLEFLAR